jgi:hypothetical protein
MVPRGIGATASACGEKPCDRMDVEPINQLDGTSSPLVEQTAILANPDLLLHFPTNVIEDVLSGQRAAIERLGDLRPDLVPRAPHLLPQISAQRTEQVREFLPVRAVLTSTRDRRTVRAVMLDEPAMTYYEGRKRLAGFIARWNVHWRELEAYIAEFKPKYVESIECQKAASSEWQVASEPDRKDLLEGFKAAALDTLDARPYGDIEVLFEDELTDATVDDALLDRYGLDLLQVYLRRIGSPQKVYRLDAQAYERKVFEALVDRSLAVRGSDIPTEQILASLSLKELNALASPPNPFARKAKAIEWLLAQPDLGTRMTATLPFRELFQLRPLPPEFSSIDPTAVSASWRRASEIGGLLAHTYAFSVSALKTTQDDREYAYGWELLATDDSCPACKRAAAKKYPKSKPPTTPVHVGCRCCLSPVMR